MTSRRVQEYVEAYKIVGRILKEELRFLNRGELYRYLESAGEFEYSTVTQKFKGEVAPLWFFRAIAEFMALSASQKGLSVSAEEYFARITKPLGDDFLEKNLQSAASPDSSDRLGDGPNVTPPPQNRVGDLVQFDIMLTGPNFSELGRFLDLELSFKTSELEVENSKFSLNLARCFIEISLDQAMADRGEERVIEDKRNPNLKLKIGYAEGVSRTRCWEIAHLETAEPILGTFIVESLCRIEEQIKSNDKARLYARAANVRVTDATGIEESNPEKQMVIDQLIKLRALPVDRDGRIFFCSQRLAR